MAEGRRDLRLRRHRGLRDLRLDFFYTPSSGDSAPFSGIQFAGQDSIIPGNRFYATDGPALSIALYGMEIRFNTDNRIYDNVDIAAGDTMVGNVLKNNVFSGSVFVANDTRWPWWVDVESVGFWEQSYPELVRLGWFGGGWVTRLAGRRPRARRACARVGRA